MTFVHLFINTNCNCVRLINSIIIINDMSEILRKILISLCLSLSLSRLTRGPFTLAPCSNDKLYLYTIVLCSYCHYINCAAIQPRHAPSSSLFLKRSTWKWEKREREKETKGKHERYRTIRPRHSRCATANP